MLIETRAIRESDDRSILAVAEALPAWFDEDARGRAIPADLRHQDGFVALADGEVVGFITLKRFRERAAEIQVMGLKAELHRRGIGRAMVVAAEERLRSEGVELFQVKTLAPSRESEHYARTRRFYEAMGFVPLEENLLWGEANPCLMLVKRL